VNSVYENGLLNKFLLATSIIGIVITFLLQDFSFLEQWNLTDQQEFVTRKILRVTLNDLFMLIFMAAWFKDHRVTKLAVAIQLFDSLVLLPIYLAVKLSLEGPTEISAPLLSQFHRLIINPTLMILLIPGIYFQQLSKKN
jgi:exosortase F-associated protein